MIARVLSLGSATVLRSTGIVFAPRSSVRWTVSPGFTLAITASSASSVIVGLPFTATMTSSGSSFAACGAVSKDVHDEHAVVVCDDRKPHLLLGERGCDLLRRRHLAKRALGVLAAARRQEGRDRRS